VKVSFPRMGWYTDYLVDYLHELDLDVVDPPPITDTTIALGTRHAGAEMLCFPYKVTLGSIIECVRAGATHVLQYNAGPDTFCRQKQFHRLAADTIHRMGMDFTMVDVSITDLIAKMVKLSGKSWGRVFRITLQHLLVSRRSEFLSVTRAQTTGRREAAGVVRRSTGARLGSSMIRHS
jgi:hypothetical protein